MAQAASAMASYACLPARSATLDLLSDVPPRDFESLRRILLKRVGGGHRFAPLIGAIHAFDLFMRSSPSGAISSFDFFSDLLPHIHSWALEYPSPRPLELPLLRTGIPSRALLSRGTIRTVLANAFFLNVLPFIGDAPASHGDETTDRFGDISFMGLYASPCKVGRERLLCLFGYFALALRMQAHELGEEVSFERHVLSQSDTPNWSDIRQKINVECIRVHTESMENSDARIFMDFANKALHIHEIIPSATQEEVLFSSCPEAFVGILISEVLRDDEVVIIRNVRRFIQYTGYASTFQFAGFYPRVRLHDIAAADATYTMHFTEAMLERDLNKAYLAFRAASSTSSSSSSCVPPSLCSDRKVSTSHWGCGVFGGDKHFKFLQQVCASALAGVTLDYSTFGEAETAASFRLLLSLIDSHHHTIASVYHAMCGYERDRGTFLDYVLWKLG